MKCLAEPNPVFLHIRCYHNWMTPADERFSYAMQWLVTLPIEIMAASMTLNYWSGARSVNPCVWVTIFLFTIVSINFFGVRGYGEAEFAFSIVKVVATLGFM